MIVSDIGMPARTAISSFVVRKLSLDQGGMIPAIALTAYARLEDRIRAMRAGFQVHV